MKDSTKHFSEAFRHPCHNCDTLDPPKGASEIIMQCRGKREEVDEGQSPVW